MLGLKLNHISKRDHRSEWFKDEISYSFLLNKKELLKVYISLLIITHCFYTTDNSHTGENNYQ